MMAYSWDAGQALLAALATLVGIPLGVITFYLRWLHETQATRHAELVRRFERIEHSAGELSKSLSQLARDYTTKEEWLRECMYVRGRMERLAEVALRESQEADARWTKQRVTQRSKNHGQRTK